MWIPLMIAGCLSWAEVMVRGENGMPEGWGADGWGRYTVEVVNGTRETVRVESWRAEWRVGERVFMSAGSGEPNAPINPGDRWRYEAFAVLPGEVARAADPLPSEIHGQVTLRLGGATSDFPFSFKVPEYRLPEPLRRMTGRHVAIEVMESRYETFAHLDRTLRWLDDSYALMIDLTGEVPFDGRPMILREAPPHPWWAYAGEVMVLNTRFVADTLRELDEGRLSFGWVHEIGHNFDTLGPWYIWNGPAAEWQANFKLAYVMDRHPDPQVRWTWGHFSPGYPEAGRRGSAIEGRRYVDAFFLPYGDAYLANASRTWTSMSSDEIHSFFQRLQRVYGWEIFQRWYRTYRRLADAGHTPPESDEDKVALIAGILERETGADLVEVFERWRFPVDRVRIDAMRARYDLDK